MPGLGYWVSMSLCSYLRQVGTVCTMSTFALCLCCVHVEGGILSLGTLFFFCSASTTAPISLGVHGWSGRGGMTKSCFLWAYSLLGIVNTSALPFPSSRTFSAARIWEASAIGWMTAAAGGTSLSSWVLWGLYKCCTVLSFFSGSKSLPHLSL